MKITNFVLVLLGLLTGTFLPAQTKLKKAEGQFYGHAQRGGVAAPFWRQGGFLPGGSLQCGEWQDEGKFAGASFSGIVAEAVVSF